MSIYFIIGMASIVLGVGGMGLYAVYYDKKHGIK